MSLKDNLDAKFGRKWRKILDQVLHFLWAFIALIPVLTIKSSPVLGCALSAVLFALPREIVDQWPIDDWGDTLLDLAFFALGGVVVGMIF
ncbi:MAG: hypothetical protein ACTSX1_08210 [Candidatus Heimdallarchaeaceae archaeon]